MNIDTEQLEMNVNLHALQPDFRNQELHYIIAENDKNFRFVNWNDEPTEGEKKFYCFLTENELLIPAGNIRVKQSYELEENALYPSVSNAADFIAAIDVLENHKVVKAVRRFLNDDVESIYQGLQEKYGEVDKHMVTSSQGQHLLFLLNDVEISVSATMVYFRYKTPYNISHYENVKEENKTE